MISHPGILVLEYPADARLPHLLHERYHVHFVCLRGNGAFRCGQRVLSFSKGDLVVLQGDLDFTDFVYSKGFRCTILAVPRGFMRTAGNGQVMETQGFIHARNHPVVSLPERSKALILDDFRSLGQRTSPFSEYGRKSVIHLLQILMYDLWEVYESLEPDPGAKIRNGNAGLFLRFQELAKDNCASERTVAWYAAELCVTPRQLSRICLSASGSGASEWIEHYSKMLIMKMLDDPALSLDEISDRLDFSSRSFFTRYVKRLLGRTPSEYRSI